MIPTTVTSSSSSPTYPVATVCTIYSSSSSSTIPADSSPSKDEKPESENKVSIVLGIASLILEGRIEVESETSIRRLLTKPSTSKSLHDVNTLITPNVSYKSKYIEKFSEEVQNIKETSDSTHKCWMQKICRMGNVLPVVIEAQQQSGPELRTLNIYHQQQDNLDEIERKRQMNINRQNLTELDGFSSVASFSNSDNFLYSLQSLASTCLRGGDDREQNISSAASSSCLKSNKSEKCTYHSLSPRNIHASNSAVNVKNKLQRSVSNICKSKNLNTQGFSQKLIPNVTGYDKCYNKNRAKHTTTLSKNLPQFGPHCELFLRKIGFTRNQSETGDIDDHCCDISRCNRWNSYCKKIETIVQNQDAVCIEVYLGPVTHKILLEQWVITQCSKLQSPTMTLPSLCSAIRSQLYFSQISAWCDLIKQADKSTYDSGRIEFYGHPNEQDAANTSMTSSCSTESSSLPTCRLNIFYKIKKYDDTADFNIKPNTHNFPNVNISENLSITVCLKSLPRINGGIPKIGNIILPGDKTSYAERCHRLNSNNKNKGINNKSLNTGSEEHKTDNTVTLAATHRRDITERDNCNIGNLNSSSTANKKIKNSFILLEATNEIKNTEHESNELTANSNTNNSNTDNDSNTNSNNNSNNVADYLTHREKQLLKYRKRMLKRDKKQQHKDISISEEDTSTSTSTSTSNSNQSSQHKSETDQLFGDSIAETILHSQSSHTTQNTEMISTGTQTAMTCCQKCGSEKELLCWKCKTNNEFIFSNDQYDDYENQMEDDASHCDIKNPRNPAELLLAAIQRTPKAAERKKEKMLMSAHNNNSTTFNAPNLKAVLESNSRGCQVCKRQKRQHIFNNPMTSDNSELNKTTDIISNANNGKEEIMESQTTKSTFNNELIMSNKEEEATNNNSEDEIFETEVFGSITTIKQPIIGLCNTELENQLSNSELAKDQAQFKTPNSSCTKSNDLSMPNMLKLTGNSVSTLEVNKGNLPKINLTPIFCNDTLDASVLDKSQPMQKSYSAPSLPNSHQLTYLSSPRFNKQLIIYKRRSRHLSDHSDRSSLGSDEQFSDDEFIESSPTSSPIKQRVVKFIFARSPLLGNLEEALLQRRIKPKVLVPGFKVLLGASGGFCPTQLTIPALTCFYELHGEILSTPYVCEISLPRKGYSVPRMGTVQVTLLNSIGTVVRMFVVPYDMRDMPPLHQTFIRQRILAGVNSSRLEHCDSFMQLNNSCKKYNNSSNGSCDDEHYNKNSDNLEINESNSKLGHFLSVENTKRLRYSIHLRFQTSRSGRLSLHSDIRLLISRRMDSDTAAAHAKGAIEATNELKTDTLMPNNPKYSLRTQIVKKKFSCS